MEALTQLDRKTAIGTLETICEKQDHYTDERDQIRELQVMLVLNVKAEIQAVDNYGDLAYWLDQRLCV